MISIELRMLVYSVALLLALVLIQAVAGVLAQGLMRMAGTRDILPPPKVFQARARRVVDNHREGLIMFVPLILISELFGFQTQFTALGAQMFFYSRFVHAVAYLVGVPFVRTVAWVVGIAGTVLVLLGLPLAGNSYTTTEEAPAAEEAAPAAEGAW